MHRILFFTLFILLFIYQTGFAQDYIEAPAAIEISSIVSDGKYTIPQIVSIAKRQGFKAVIITDSDTMRWEYGLWPLRNVIKKTVEEKSISNYGIQRYLDDLKKVQEDNVDMVIVPAVESAPFYYWQGSMFNNNLKMVDWHKHFLAIGLQNTDDYRFLPVIGNKRGLKQPFQPGNILLLWPIILLIYGLCLRRKKKSIGIVFIAVGLLFLINNYPFRTMLFDQYHGEQGIRPYQNHIDYVKQRGGLTFWAHPEASNTQKQAGVSLETLDHSDDLLLTDGYSGFALFYEGCKRIGCRNGIWDEVLMQYCKGIRKTPVWAIGALSFDSDGNLEDYLKDLRTVCLVKSLNRQSVLDALKNGRMYVANGAQSSNFILDSFIVKNLETAKSAVMGEEVEITQYPQVEIQCRFLNGQNKTITIKLVRGGKVIKTFETGSPANFIFSDEQVLLTSKDYYRLEIQSEGLVLFSNPIFIKKKNNL